MNILSIGNSFSEDAQRYIHGIARSMGDEINTYNLYIGGCPLAFHFRNFLGDEKRYEIGVNGTKTYFYTTIKEALLACDWDVVTLQQASGFSFKYESFQPYISELADAIRRLCPKAKIVVHQTWAYEDGSWLLSNVGLGSRAEMFAGIKDAYAKAAKDIGADFVIPSGELMEKLTELGIEKVHRDTFHAKLGVSRFAIGLLWYAVLTGKSVDEIGFADFDEEVTSEEIEIAKNAVKAILEN